MLNISHEEREKLMKELQEQWRSLPKIVKGVPTINVACLKLNKGVLPIYQTYGSAGLDLKAAINTPVTISSGGRSLIPTGIAIALPEGTEAQIRPRSGLAIKHGVTVLNSPGTIDSDYRGEIKVILINHGEEEFVVTPRMRIAQMVVSKYIKIEMHEVEEIPQTMRSDQGFGSTGV